MKRTGTPGWESRNFLDNSIPFMPGMTRSVISRSIFTLLPSQIESAFSPFGACRMVSKGEFVGLRFRVLGVETFDPGAVEAYLIDETTGEKFPVVRLQRIGRLAEFTVPGEKDVHNILFRNREGKLKLGTRVTVVFGSIRKEHLQLQE